MTLHAAPARWIGIARWLSFAVIVVSVFVLTRSLVSPEVFADLQQWIESLGAWGPLALGVVYVAGVVLLVPASALTIAAGAIFGLGVGTIIVSISATTGAALAFLIGRYAARARVEEAIRTRPRLQALDRAIDEGGWRIVALLRLSPAVPFNLQNYFYGLTSIKFWPCVVTSWAAMLPGTFLYVYIGTLTGEVVAGGREKSPYEWTLLAVGLAATVAVTVYLTRLARRRLAEVAIDGPEAAAGPEETAGAVTPIPLRLFAFAGLMAALALLETVGGGIAHVGGWFSGPPAVEMQETYAADTEGAAFDHTAYDALLKEFVAEGGWVDYAELATRNALLESYLDALADADFDALSRDEKLAFYLNAYNACTLKLILDHAQEASILDIPASERWLAKRWRIAGETLSLDEIEHERIRPNFREPRIHFALVCAAIGCPPLRREAYAGDQLEAQLQDQADYVHRHARWFQLEDNALHLTPLYEWYRGDFEQVAGSILEFAASYSAPLGEQLDAHQPPQVHWLPYDWTLNDLKNRPAEAS
ncbi:MAG: DUF547 domain-containing protein [Candidatus Hydrogenedens sp.]|nr:DUF547 domain-containing protein [Candidatus Hydrogenedens sp.]